MNTVTGKEQRWPVGVQCAINFGIDVDGETLWTSRDAENWNRPANLAQGSYGPRIGVPKILNVLDKHDVKATFFIPAWIIEKYPEMAREVIERGHEVGYHGYLHEFDMTAGYELEKEIMDKSLDIFERILKIRPRGLRSPMCEMTEATMRLMHEYEFLYSSTMMDDDFPYFWKYQGKTSNIVELPIQWMWDDSSYFFFTLSDPVRRGISTPSKVLEIWKCEFDGVLEYGAILDLVIHPQLSGRYSRIKLIDDLLTYMKSKEGTWIATCEEIAGYWQDAHGAAN